jgi:hypothetical protein
MNLPVKPPPFKRPLFVFKLVMVLIGIALLAIVIVHHSSKP